MVPAVGPPDPVSEEKLDASETSKRISEPGRMPHPELQANILSVLSYWWFNPLLALGYKRPLEDADLYKLRPQDSASYVLERFYMGWEKQRDKPRPALWKALNSAFGWEFWISGGMLLFYFLCTIASPLVLQELTVFVGEHYRAQFPDAPPPSHGTWYGYVMMTVMFVIQQIATVVYQRQFHLCMAAGYNTRTSLILAIYRKALRLSGQARQIYPHGTIMNLVATDCSRLDIIAGFLNLIWVTPLVIACTMAVLLWKLGVASLVGFGFMALYLPLQTYLAKLLTKYRSHSVKLTDRRVRLTQELLQGIRVVKLYGWENCLLQRIYNLRKTECREILKLMVTRGALFAAGMVLPAFATIFSVITYVYMGHALEAGVIFASLALFNVLRVPLMMLPQLVSFYTDARVSLTRVRDFLLAKELPMGAITDQSSSDAVQIINGTFVWDGPPSPKISQADKPTHSRAHKVFIKLKKLKRLRKPFQKRTNKIPVATLAGGSSTSLTTPEQASITSDSQRMVRLENLQVRIPHGQLVGVVGAVGSGKSSLLNALVGEMRCEQGQVVFSGSVSYCAQSAWIQNATVRDNILFGQPHDPERYQRVVKACALLKDFQALPYGDLTEIGERGISLSGGQKQRLNIARAVYFDADIVLMDDPLSAVDSHVGKHLFYHCIREELAHKTRVLVTHQLHFMPYVDYILYMEDGRIMEQGTYAELMVPGTEFFQLMTAYGGVDDVSSEVESSGQPLSLHNEKGLPSQESMDIDTHLPLSTGVNNDDGNDDISDLEDALGTSTDDEAQEKEEPIQELVNTSRIFTHHDMSAPDFESQLSTIKRLSKEPLTEVTDPTLTPASYPKVIRKTIQQDGKEKSTSPLGASDGKIPPPMMQTEERATGSVVYAMYKAYFFVCGGWWALFIVLFTICGMHATKLMTDMWLQFWVMMQFAQSREFYVGLYLMWGVVQTFFGLAVATSTSYYILKGSLALHNQALNKVIKAPVSFFDTTPLGRIINRFSKDVDGMDNLMLEAWRGLFNQIAGLIACFLLIIVNFPIFLAPLVPIMAFYVWFAAYYRSTSRELKRLDSISRSPLFAHFQESLQGMATIRAYKEETRFHDTNLELMQTNNRAYTLTIMVQRWLGFRLETISNLLLLFTALFAVLSRKSVDPAATGLVLTYALQTAGILSLCVRQAADVENNMNAVERLEYYIQELEQEPPSEIADRKPPPEWPQKGVLSMKQVVLRYRPDLPPVLQGVNLTTQPAEKIGIVGRTGAGKSSIMMALFRMAEIDEGVISLDGINLGDLGLHDVRRRMAIIPQDPVIFEGTIRSNLDPEIQYPDEELWRVLERTDLKTWASLQPQQLETQLNSDGDALSAGQRQLLCLARAMLRRSRVVVLDEATASVDMQTDALLQQILREDFKDCTVLTIAHRLNTIIDYDRILVIDGGTVREFDTPHNLLLNENSQFYSMVQETGPVNAALLISTAIQGEVAVLNPV
ncbi:hypothetical protein IWQ61_005620 [Dispira simplex]|nr:hypothetical protein IWQ61_005620 [Dispira simplex]